MFPLFVEKGLHGSDVAYTVVYSSFSAGAFVGALAVARRKTVEVGTVAFGAACLGGSMLALSFVPNVAVAVVVAAVVGAGSVAFMTAATAIAQIRSDQEMIGRVLAIQTVLIIGTTPIGGPILGVLSDVVGARSPVFIGGVGALAAALFGLLAGRRVRSHATSSHREEST